MSVVRFGILIALVGGFGLACAHAPAPAPVAATVATKAAAPIEPPPQFLLCSACHPVSKDGAHGMGPNLRGVVGRRAGSLNGFAYSAAMRASALQWNRDALHAYLQNPPAAIPGNTMAYGGMSDADERSAIIDYLEQLK